ncbi:hypothetical protein [Neisseria chenwenguii]|uniref:Uncharacterized protein n=1 Tax=Neisseria chenwenguii TaxID=1853278 RepID=A0A220RZ32_9NEIS|nr:hypothetical protein [Neisseria chenwenguii]ASK26398.1 hypothetical protein BG910_00330 [Neisseria chenwenguii]ROV55819.1 hypothetical protein EGS38_07825 [Neisseria chenwenguii]
MLKKFMPIFAAAWLLAACTFSDGLPRPHLPQTAVSADGRWFQMTESDKAGKVVQTSLLAVAQETEGLRFVQTDALGVPKSRQILTRKGWKNDGFVMPNAASRQVFAAMLPYLVSADTLALYPDAKQMPSENGALFRYKNRDLWRVSKQGDGLKVVLPDGRSWLVIPADEEK